MTPAEPLVRLLARAQARGWAGSDPYDALLSIPGRAVSPFGAFPRFILSQLALRSPAVRWAICPPQSVNPKGLALFLGAVVRGREVLGDERARSLSRGLVGEIERRGTRAGDGMGWGYPFSWQSRSFWAPARTPNAVVTATVGWHLLDCGDVLGDGNAYKLGAEAGRFLYTALSWAEVGNGVALAYTLHDRTRVVNVSALAARLLARVGALTSSPELAALASGLVRFVLDAQRPDGSWPYAVQPGSGWEDSFHTGYVLEALLHCRELGVNVPEAALDRGFDAYARFFGEAGEARLTPHPRGPLDAHSAAQGILTYLTLAASSAGTSQTRAAAQETALRIADWALRDLWMPERGYFAYRIRGGRRDEREFTRWVQAWMALALAAVSSREAGVALRPGRREATVA